MMDINYELTSKLAKQRLDDLTGMIKSNLISVEKMKQSDINKKTNFADLVTFRFQFKGEEKIQNDLMIISRLDLESKQILYCVHCLGESRWRLKLGIEDYSFGRPYEIYDKALLKFGLANEELIIYQD